METITAGQCWTYRAPPGFEQSRLIVGATVELNDKSTIVCCSVVRVPYRPSVAPEPTFTIPFLPMTAPAFQASAVNLTDDAEPPGEFFEALHQWRLDGRGLAAFTLPFSGLLDQFVEMVSVEGQVARGIAEKNPGPLLNEIATMLASGLETETEPFPRDHMEFAEILVRLRQLDADDLKGKLVIGGFVDHPYGPGQQRCLECIYYLPNNLWCDIPELAVPVEPYWWCRLWRI